MKSYQRYEPNKLFGVLNSSRGSSNGSICYDFSGNLALTTALQNINVINLRLAQQVGTIESEDFLIRNGEYPYKCASDVCIIERSPVEKSPILAAGQSNGDIRIINYLTREVLATLRGHKSSVSCIRFESDSFLASGGIDCDIIMSKFIIKKRFTLFK
jgi:U3 small nucleolar RNA-associated protein 12